MTEDENVPLRVLNYAIKYGKQYPDPKGSEAIMYRTEMYRGDKLYNLEVLYDQTSNTIYHFLYK